MTGGGSGIALALLVARETMNAGGACWLGVVRVERTLPHIPTMGTGFPRYDGRGWVAWRLGVFVGRTFQIPRLRSE